MPGALAYDLIVVGGGPGGYSAAIRASQLGLRTALVEAAELGGVCLNWGCIPTKALLHCAELVHDIRQASRFGIEARLESIDLAAVVKHSRATADKLSRGVAYLMKKNDVALIAGRAALADKGVVEVRGPDGDTRRYRSPHIILATGASLRSLPGLDASDEKVWSAREAMIASSIPETLVIIGAGAIGVEFASFYADLGSMVTLVEALDRILPTEDPEISERMARTLTARGIQCLADTRFEAADTSGDQVRLTLSHGEQQSEISCERVLVAVGVTANTTGMNLESLGVAMDLGFIGTDDYGRTSVAGLYAIGDVAGAPWLAHKATHEGVACVEKLAGLDPKPASQRLIPGCIYARPQIASIGLTEDAARRCGLSYKVGRFDLQANGKALASGHEDGLVKVVLDSATGELLGAHMIGHGVSEQIQGYAIAMGAELTEHEFDEVVFPHPTQSEAMHEALLDADKRAINQ
ncbi:MAG: dihydrolipoyl dehydrogenase [Pseudomonadota bacterium]